MANRYIVVKSQIDGDDIQAEEFDNYIDALKCVQLDECKAVVIKAENLPDDAKLVIEWHT